MTKISAEEVQGLFDYVDGVLVWKVKLSRNTRLGQKVGSFFKQVGYCVAKIHKKPYYVHRLVWAWHHGEWPANSIDHVDRDTQNNRIENLRVATLQENNWNRSTHDSAGVRERKGRWLARYGDRHLGSFNTKEEARQVYLDHRRAVEGKFFTE